MSEQECPLCRGKGTVRRKVLKKSTKFKGQQIIALQSILLSALETSSDDEQIIVADLLKQLYRSKNPLWDSKEGLLKTG